MSKLKAVLITAIVGSSTAAMASPSYSFSADAQFSWGASSNGAIVRDHRDRTPAPLPMPSTTWISLGAPLELATGRDVVRPDAGNYTQLRLQATSGLSYIQKVVVRFRDGGRQVVTFNQWLTNRNPMLQFDLEENHRAIDSIMVIGTAGWRNQSGSYQVFAQGTRQVSMPHLPQYPAYELPVSQPSYPAPTYPTYPTNPAPVVNQTPVLLASELTFANTFGFRQFPVNANLGTFSTLRVQGYGAGPMPIARVIVTFADGQVQEIDNINRTLAPGQAMDLRLDARGEGHITQLAIYTNDTMTPVNANIGSFMISAL